MTIVGNGRLAADRAVLGTVRPHPDGRPDARDERARGDGGHPRARTHGRRARADRRADGARDGRRSRTVPGGGHGRLRVEAAAVRRTVLRDRRGRDATSRRSTRARHAESSRDTLDRDVLLAGFGGRADLLKHVVDVFLEDAPAILARLKEALRTGNGASAAAAAHALKGSVGLFSQGQAYEEARRLEQLGRSGELTGDEAAVPRSSRRASRGS